MSTAYYPALQMLDALRDKPVPKGKVEILDRHIGYFSTLGQVPNDIIKSLRTGAPEDETRGGFLIDENALIARMFERRKEQNMAAQIMMG